MNRTCFALALGISCACAMGPRFSDEDEGGGNGDDDDGGDDGGDGMSGPVCEPPCAGDAWSLALSGFPKELEILADDTLVVVYDVEDAAPEVQTFTLAGVGGARVSVGRAAPGRICDAALGGAGLAVVFCDEQGFDLQAVASDLAALSWAHARVIEKNDVRAVDLGPTPDSGYAVAGYHEVTGVGDVAFVHAYSAAGDERFSWSLELPDQLIQSVALLDDPEGISVWIAGVDDLGRAPMQVVRLAADGTVRDQTALDSLAGQPVRPLRREDGWLVVGRSTNPELIHADDFVRFDYFDAAFQPMRAADTPLSDSAFWATTVDTRSTPNGIATVKVLNDDPNTYEVHGFDHSGALLGWTPFSMEPDFMAFAELEVASDGSLFVLTDVANEDVVDPDIGKARLHRLPPW